MSKAKQNKFLLGYFGVLALGAVALGYFAWSSYSGSVEAKQLYEDKRTQLTSLRNGRIFPNQENVDAKKRQVDSYVNKVSELVKTIYSYQTAPEAISNSQFQIKLANYRDAVVVEAGNSGVKLPADFTLGMTTYLAEAPKPDAVPELNAWLEALNFFVRTLIVNGVNSIDELVRVPQPFEAAAAPVDPKKKPAAPARSGSTTASAASRSSAKKDAGLPESEVIRRYPFTAKFTGSSRAVNAVLSQLANTSPERQAPFFFEIRAIRLENEKKEAPARNEEVKATEVTVEGSDRKIQRDSAYIYGDEKITAFLVLDLLRFVEPAAK